MMEFLFELIGEILMGLIPTPKSKMEKNMEKLKQEKWFLSLWQDYRYQHILFHNKKVKRTLRNNQLVDQLLTIAHEREKFIELVKHEHEKYVKLG